MEASALTHASKRGLLARRSRVLKLQGDEKLVALIRAGHDRAFEALFDRYHSRLLAFCQHMLSSKEDAEDVLQDVFVAAHKAMLADNRRINVRPWLYRIARNRCLNHLRRPMPEGQDSMDILPHENGATTLERVQNREEFRRLIADVGTLPETQRTALLLREVDAMSYEEIAQAMDTTVPSVKSLLVRARITLAEATQARLLTCGEVQLELAEAAEGLRKASGPVRQHVRSCDGCADFRSQLRSDSKALTALAPLGGLALLKETIVAKLAALTGGGGSTAGGGAAGGGAAAGGAAGAGGAAAGTGMAGAALSATGAAGAAGGIGGAIGAKAAAGVATAALLTAGAVEVNHYVADSPAPSATASRAIDHATPAPRHGLAAEAPNHKPKPEAAPPPPPPDPEPATQQTSTEPTSPATTETTQSPPPPEAHADSDTGASQVPTNQVSATPVGYYEVESGTVEEAPATEPPPESLPPVEEGSGSPPPPPPPAP